MEWEEFEKRVASVIFFEEVDDLIQQIAKVAQEAGADIKPPYTEPKVGDTFDTQTRELEGMVVELFDNNVYGVQDVAQCRGPEQWYFAGSQEIFGKRTVLGATIVYVPGCLDDD